jgi:glyoxylase I family protein
MFGRRPLVGLARGRDCRTATTIPIRHNPTCSSFFKLAWWKAGSQNTRMRLEHVAVEVPDPVAMADWYVKHLGCSIARSGGEPNLARFLQAGPVLIEISKSASAPTPDYAAVQPSQLHFAFVANNIKEDRDRLVAAGANVVEDYFTNPAGDELLMLRDPWDIPLQLVKRTAPMLS